MAASFVFNDAQSLFLALHVILKSLKHGAVHIATRNQVEVVLLVKLLCENDALAIHPIGGTGLFHPSAAWFENDTGLF